MNEAYGSTLKVRIAKQNFPEVAFIHAYLQEASWIILNKDMLTISCKSDWIINIFQSVLSTPDFFQSLGFANFSNFQLIDINRSGDNKLDLFFILGIRWCHLDSLKIAPQVNRKVFVQNVSGYQNVLDISARQRKLENNFRGKFDCTNRAGSIIDYWV